MLNRFPLSRTPTISAQSRRTDSFHMESLGLCFELEFVSVFVWFEFAHWTFIFVWKINDSHIILNCFANFCRWKARGTKKTSFIFVANNLKYYKRGYLQFIFFESVIFKFSQSLILTSSFPRCLPFKALLRSAPMGWSPGPVVRIRTPVGEGISPDLKLLPLDKLGGSHVIIFPENLSLISPIYSNRFVEWCFSHPCKCNWSCCCAKRPILLGNVWW